MLVTQRPKMIVRGQRQNLRKRQGYSPKGRRNVNPPQILSNVVKNHTFRYLASSGFSGAISAQMILGAMGTICTTTNSVVTFINESFKVNRISMWAPPASQGAATTVSVNWIGSMFSPNKEVSDTSVSVSHNSQLHCKPPPLSSASFWQPISGNNVFSLVAPAGTVIDINVSIVEGDDEVIGTANVATGVLTHTYYLALDGPTSNLLVPVSLATTH